MKLILVPNSMFLSMIYSVVYLKMHLRVHMTSKKSNMAATQKSQNQEQV